MLAHRRRRACAARRYRLKHIEGADGFVSMRRPGPAAGPGADASRGGQPKSPMELLFLASVALTVVGTFVGTQACSSLGQHAEGGWRLSSSAPLKGP